MLQVPPLSSYILPVRWADLSRTAAAAHQESFSEPDQAAAGQITQPAGLRLYVEKFSAEFKKAFKGTETISSNKEEQCTSGEGEGRV